VYTIVQLLILDERAGEVDGMVGNASEGLTAGVGFFRTHEGNEKKAVF